MNEASIQLDLSRNEALVLFEFLSRYSDSDELTIVDQAEQRVLWDLCCLLEKSLTEPFASNYHDVISRARDAIRDKSD